MTEFEQRIEQRLDRLERSQQEVSTRLGVVEARQKTIDRIDENTASLVQYVIGTSENPGLLHEFRVLQAFETREHGAGALLLGVSGMALGAIISHWDKFLHLAG